MEVNGRAERILVLAPVGRDGPLACRVLRQAGLTAVPCATMEELCRELEAGAGALLLTEEALEPEPTRRLVESLGRQPSWSDVPVVVLTRGGGAYSRLRALRTLEPLGNVTFLERPLRIMTLVSTVRMSLRARRRQYELCDLLGRLQQGVRQRDDFLAMLAHELRNPLAPIRNAVEMLRRQDRLDPEQVGWAADLVDRQSQQLTRMVDDLLEVSRITRGKITLKPEPADLATIVHRAVESSRPLIDARQHHLSVALADEPLRVRADVARLTQVLTNLLNNAAKYTDEGGHIALTVERQGREAVLRVRDSGMGIPADLLPRVFEPFTQGGRSGERVQGGLGLGLAVARKLVEMHGGRVQAFSDGPGRGSEFVVRLPLLAWERPAAAPAGEGTGRPAGDSGRRVLVVEDNRDAADSLAVLLRLAGHEVRVAYDGPSALAEAPRFRPDVILLDIGLPRLDGCEVARQLRRQTGLQDVLLVALTGFGQEQDRRRSREAGFDAHFVKPVDFAALQAVLARPPGSAA
ncbi:MAG TPA: ATP-binding protein [Gemmataceae bacterium]|nr:ATP-binding protein [Gemmataceae bacterium]